MSIDSDAVASMISRITSYIVEAGIEITEDLSSGVWFFYDSGIEDRLQIREWNLVFSGRERRLPFRDEFITSSLDDMEKYLIYYFCSTIRSRKGLARLLVVPIPLTVDKVASGYEIRGGPGMYELVNALSGTIRYASITELIKFSHYADLSPEELYDACTAPNGKPPFFIAK